MEAASTPFDTREINFTDYLSSARDSFTGRRWLFEEIEDAFDSTPVTVALIVGEPGTGKSALVAQLICSRLSSPVIHRRILGYHLCKHSDRNTQNPGKFVRNLAEMMARRIPEYGLMVANNSLILRTLDRIDCFQDPIGCFEQAVLIPLRALRNRPSDKWYIVIDAMDECLGHERLTIADLIDRKISRFPTWLKLIVTSRNDTKVFEYWSNVKMVDIKPHDNRNLEDISIYLTQRLYREGPLTYFIKSLFGIDSVENTNNLISELLNKSQGNFLFVKEMLQYWETSQEARKEPYALPKTLGGIYRGYFERLYGGGRAFEPVRRILEVLVSAFEPMTSEGIFQLLLWKGDSDPAEYEFKDFQDTMKTLGHFVRFGVNDSVSLYHLYLVDWLTSNENKGPFFVSKEKGHERFCDFYLALIRNGGESGLTKHILPLAQHIAHAKWKDRYVKEFQKFPSQTVNSTDIGGNRTLLHIAATIDNAEVLKLLLQHFSCIDCEDDRGFTPAFLAAEQGLLKNVKLLIEQGAKTNHKTKSLGRISEDHMIARTENSTYQEIRDILHGGIVFQTFNDHILQSKTAFWESTMMHAAAQSGHSNVVQFLLEEGAFVSIRNGVHLTPLHLAAEGGHLAVVKLLHEAGAIPDQTALHHAAANNRIEVVKYLLQVGVEDSCVRCDGSFYWLSGMRRWSGNDMAKIFCPLKADLNESSIDPSQCSCECDFGKMFDDRHLIRCESALHAAVSSGHEAIVTLLVKQNHSAIHCHDYTGRTPLHEAVRKNNTSIIKILVQAKAKMETGCNFWQALTNDSDDKRSGYRHLNLDESLEYEQDVCHCGYTPLHLAARYGLDNVGLLLYSLGAKANLPDCNGATPLHVAACHDKAYFAHILTHSKFWGAGTNQKSYNGSTPLHSAASCRTMDVIGELLYLGANVSATDQKGMSALHYSVLHVKAQDISWELDINTTSGDSKNPEGPLEIITVDWAGKLAGFHEKDGHIRNTFSFRWLDTLTELALRMTPLALNAVDSDGRTALHLAAANGLADAVNVLIQIGAGLDHRDKQGKTALDLAVENATLPFMKPPFHLSKSFEYTRNFLSDHSMAVHLLLSAGASFKRCNRKKRSLLHVAIANCRPYIAQMLLQKGASLKCRDHLGRTPLVAYLHNGGGYTDAVLQFFNVTLVIKCKQPFNSSLLHLISYRRPTEERRNFFVSTTGSKDQCHAEDGPLIAALKQMKGRYNRTDTCVDAEGFTALHRAAQGANAVAIRSLLALGANPLLPSPQHGLDSLWLTILHRDNDVFWKSPSVEKTITRLWNLDRVSGPAIELLEYVYNNGYRIECNPNKAELTLYHAAASRGLVDFVKHLLVERERYGVDVNCTNKHGITPMYLAKVFGQHLQEQHNPWESVVDIIREHGGELRYPDNEIHLYVLHNYLYAAIPAWPLQLKVEEHVRHFLIGFVGLFNTSERCERYLVPHDEDFVFSLLDRFFNGVLEKIQSILRKRYISKNSFLSTIMARAVDWSTRICLGHLQRFSRLFRELQFSHKLSSLFEKSPFSILTDNKFTVHLQIIMEKGIAKRYDIWKSDAEMKTCLKDWFFQFHWLLGADKAKFRSLLEIYLDLSKHLHLYHICQMFRQSISIYHSWSLNQSMKSWSFWLRRGPSPGGVPSYDQGDERSPIWPLDFLVKLVTGEFSHLSYLEVLYVAMKPGTTVQLYEDKVMDIITRPLVRQNMSMPEF